jgi:predicted metalloprotease with PDZ domain
MGQAESSQVGTSSSLHDPQLGHNTVAFHVLRVAENSPAAQAGLDPFFDFIVGVNGTQLVSPPHFCQSWRSGIR